MLNATPAYAPVPIPSREFLESLLIPWDARPFYLRLARTDWVQTENGWKLNKVPCCFDDWRRNEPMKSGIFSARTALRIIHKLHDQDPEARNRVGLGLVFRPGMPIFMTDHDGGVVSPQVAHINASHPTLTEVSISGKGLHKYYLGSALAGLDKGKLKFDFHGSKIEWFGWTGFSFLTGNVDPNQPAQLADGSALQAELMEVASKADKTKDRSTSPGVTLPSGLRELPSTDQITARARAYMDKVSPAVSGQHGHDATMYAACRLVLGFDLTPADALPLMEEWNTRCSPPWGTRV
jgi:hypothetical protein